LLILDGHESHHSTEFELHCQQKHYHALHASTLLPSPPATRCRLLRAIEAGVRPPG
jgi:hypothetical protein